MPAGRLPAKLELKLASKRAAALLLLAARLHDTAEVPPPPCASRKRPAACLPAGVAEARR